MKKLTQTDFIVPALLLALSTVPMLGGAMRLARLAGAEVTAEDARFLAAPVPVLVHALAAALYALLGAFQFSRGIRLRWPRWHRRAGRALALSGLAVAFSGLWMTLFYPIPSSLQGPILYVVRLGVGVAMLVSLTLGVSSILRRDVTRHEAWMIRAYALAQGAGTQALILLPWILITGEALGLTRDLLMTAAWAINCAVAEAFIRRASSERSRGHAALPRDGMRASPVGSPRAGSRTMGHRTFRLAGRKSASAWIR